MKLILARARVCMHVQAFRVHFDETLWLARLHNDRYLFFTVFGEKRR